MLQKCKQFCKIGKFGSRRNLGKCDNCHMVLELGPWNAGNSTSTQEHWQEAKPIGGGGEEAWQERTVGGSILGCSLRSYVFITSCLGRVLYC